MQIEKIQRATRLAICLTLPFFVPSVSFAHIDEASTTDPQCDAQVFEQHCIACRNGFLGSRAPAKQVVAGCPPRSIVDTDIPADSQWNCKANPKMSGPGQFPQWNGWANIATKPSSQSAQAAGLTAAPAGCTYWQFTVEAGVRGAADALGFDEQAQGKVGGKFGVLFGDMPGNACALNAETGRFLRRVNVDAHPKDITHCRSQSASDFDIGGPPLIVPGRSSGVNKDFIVASQKSGVATALDPERNVAGAMDFVDSSYGTNVDRSGSALLPFPIH